MKYLCLVQIYIHFIDDYKDRRIISDWEKLVGYSIMNIKANWAFLVIYTELITRDSKILKEADKYEKKIIAVIICLNIHQLLFY